MIKTGGLAKVSSGRWLRKSALGLLALFSMASSVAIAAPPASITATSGGGQRVQINTAFANPLVATVKGTDGKPVASAIVTFAAPSSGASGTFAGGGATATATTDTSGVATSPTFTANATAGSYNVNATVTGVTAPATFTLTNTAGPASSITATSGGGQSAQLNTPFGNPLAATVKDSGGNQVANVTVTFSAPSSGASGTFSSGATTATATTNASGVATSPTFTANATAGNYNVNATVTGVTAPATFALSNTPGSASSITATSGGGQSAQINSHFQNPLVATVKDAGGNPVANATVTFAAPGSGASGTFTAGGTTATATTNASGVATSPTFTANATVGNYNVNATVTGVTTPATFSLSNTPGSAASITATSGGGQSAQINSSFSNPLVATVKDSGDNPVANATVTFAAPSSGASVTFGGGVTTITATTNSSGVASSPPLTANATSGSYNVNATVGGASAPATFALTNTAGGPASISATSGNGQSAQVNSAFSSTLVATVKDAGGNPVANAMVIFTAPGSGPSGAFTGAGTSVTVATNTSGVATSPTLVADTKAGGYSVNATVAGVAAGATFALNNTAAAPASIGVSAGSGQSAQISSAFGSPMVAIVKDTYGNPVSNVSVTFAAPSSPASGTFSGSGTAAATTNSSGLATSPAFTASTTAGSYTVNATVSGAPGQASFALTNTPGGPASISSTSGGGQSAPVNNAFGSLLVVSVKDSGGNPVANATVTFTAPPSGASGSFAGAGITAAAQTNASGLASSPAFSANGTAGSYTINAAVTGLTAQASFAMTNTAGAAASITVTLGSGQTAQVKTNFVNPLEVAIKDASGNPVANATVTFSVPGTGASGTFAGTGTAATAQTNSSGLAVSPTLSANGTAGAFTATATVSGLSSAASFSLNNISGAPGSITATSGSGQNAQINKAFNNALVATVTDSNNNPVANATVTFLAPGSGASGVFSGSGLVATATTNGSGVAASPIFTANAIQGNYSVVASVSGAATSASFALANTAGPPASITASSGSGQSARVNSAFNNPLVVTVKDSGGNPVGGASVTFTAPAAGASAAFGSSGATVTVQANNSGVATSPAISANGTTGSYSVIASVAGASGQAMFALTNVSGLTITTTTLPDGAVGLQYPPNILSSAAGNAPYNWSIAKGTLPPGLTLDAPTGSISGMPTTEGTYQFTVMLTDSSTPPQTATQPLSISIGPSSTGSVVPVFTISGIPSAPAPGINITGATVQLSQPSSASYSGTLSLNFTPNANVSGLPAGYTGDAGFVSSSGAKSTTMTLAIPAATTSVPIPAIDPGTVAGSIAINLVVGGQASPAVTITVAPMAPIIEASSVQIIGVTSTGFSVELVATSTTRELTNATFTFIAAPGASISGNNTFTVDVSSLLSQWFASSNGLTYGGAFTLTLPFSLSGSASAIQSVSVKLTNSVGTSAAVSGTQ